MPDAFAHYGTGSRPLSPDWRDWSALLHPAIAQAVLAGTADTVRLGGQIGGIYDQGAEGACVAYSEAGAVSREETIQGRPWVWLDAENLYRRNGGHDNVGVDTRQTLQDIVANGINRRDGGAPIHEASYLFVPKQPGVWEATIMAALSVGKPVVLATYLQDNFGWDSSGPPNPNRYHQVYLDAGDPTWWECVNTWGAGFGRGGRGRLLKSYVDPLRPDVYAYIITPLDSLPPPPPPPPPPPVNVALIEATATGPGAGSLRVGDTLQMTSGLQMVLSKVQINGGPGPSPTPGDLKVNVVRGRGYLAATVQNGSGVFLTADCDAVLGGRDLGTRQTVAQAPSARAAIWTAANVLAGTEVVVTAKTSDGRTGEGRRTL